MGNFLKRCKNQHYKRVICLTTNKVFDTINKYIDNLEQDLGVKLISTSGRGSNLTNVAQRIVGKMAKIKEVLDDISNIKLENREIKWKRLNNQQLYDSTIKFVFDDKENEEDKETASSNTI